MNQLKAELNLRGSWTIDELTALADALEADADAIRNAVASLELQRNGIVYGPPQRNESWKLNHLFRDN